MGLSIDDPVDPNSNNGDSSGAKTAAQATTGAAAESKAEEEEQPGSIPAPLDPALTLTAADVKAALDDAKVNHPDPKAAPATDEKADEEADGVDRADQRRSNGRNCTQTTRKNGTGRNMERNISQACN